jgi:hypothetical protein
MMLINYIILCKHATKIILFLILQKIKWNTWKSDRKINTNSVK